MTREEALKELSSTSAHDRLRAARFLVRHSDPADLQLLRDALKVESVAYVRTGLELAIKKTRKVTFAKTAEAHAEFEVPSDVKTQIRNEVMEEVAGQILHEITSPVGLIASAASREVPNYEQSRTKRYIENLKRVFKAIEQLKGAAAVPRPQEFDLAELLSEIVNEETEGQTVEISLHGAKPMLIISDRELVRLALSNGLRNAIEAVLGSAQNEPHPVVVTWGETDIDYWISVLDRGPGVVGPAESAFGIGKTTKKGHSGFGLAIARQAIETLGGVCTLQPAAQVGARFEIRWER